MLVKHTERKKRWVTLSLCVLATTGQIKCQMCRHKLKCKQDLDIVKKKKSLGQTRGRGAAPGGLRTKYVLCVGLAGIEGQ